MTLWNCVHRIVLRFWPFIIFSLLAFRISAFLFICVGPTFFVSNVLCCVLFFSRLYLSILCCCRHGEIKFIYIYILVTKYICRYLHKNSRPLYDE